MQVLEQVVEKLETIWGPPGIQTMRESMPKAQVLESRETGIAVGIEIIDFCVLV